MSRSSRTRHRRRKARRLAIREGRLPRWRPSFPLRPDQHEDVHGPVQWRDPRTRWLGLSTRGGHSLSFRPTGLVVPVDCEASDAPERFAEAVRAELARAPTVD